MAGRNRAPSKFVPAVLVAAAAVIGSTPHSVRITIFVAAQDDVPQRCGDCWCVIDDGSGTCPEYGPGLSIIPQDFDDNYEILTTFELTSPTLDFQPPDGADACFPYAEQTGGSIDATLFAESDRPQCIYPPKSDLNTLDGSTGAVCAYKFENGTQCMGRKYEMISYDSAELAIQDNATITHSNACGICSSATDLWARINNPDIDSKTASCATRYVFGPRNTRFETLVGCMMELGFTRPCATLWAFSSASNAILCAEKCIVDENFELRLNLDPPQCEFAECLACGEAFGSSNRRMGGRVSLDTSGIIEEVALPCSGFTPIIHDPCVGATTGREEFEGSGGGGDNNGNTGGSGGAGLLSHFPQFAPLVSVIVLFLS